MVTFDFDLKYLPDLVKHFLILSFTNISQEMQNYAYSDKKNTQTRKQMHYQITVE